MKKNQTVKATIKKLGINGEGIAYLDRKITFVQGALPGEEVQIEIVGNEAKYKVGTLKSIIKPSEDRVKAKCRLQKDCLGCPLMVMDYQAQLNHKYLLVKDTFTKYVGEAFAQAQFDSVLPSASQFGIRGIVRLPVVSFEDKVTFGIYQRESKYLTLMTHCPMQSKRINSCLEKIETIMNDLHLHVYDEVKKKGIRFLTVREFDNGLQLIFVTGLDRLPDRAIEAFSQIEGVSSIYLTVNTTRKQGFELQRYELKYGKSQMEQIFMQKPFQISSKADFPVYRQHALRVAKQLAALMPEDIRKVADVGCGIGLYSLGLADQYEIHGIDSSKINIRDAQNNATLQNRHNAVYEEGRIDQLFTVLSKKYHFDLVMLHPDAFKMTDALTDSLIASKTKYLLWERSHVSMLAKNIAALTKIYTLEKVVCLDGNPNGAGVHTICLMKRK